jgi:fatty acid desaturase
MLGIADLFDAVTDRLDMVSITLTTEYQQRMTALQCWLTVVFGATEVGFIAASLATWYYRSGLWVVLAWTVGAAVLSDGVLVALLRRRLRD